MKKHGFQTLALLISCSTSLSMNSHAAGETAQNDEEEMLVLGTRRTDRSVLESSVAIDVINAEDIKRSGVTQTVELLQQIIPSFTAQKNSITDATDYVRPAQLRGLAPDHVLVLVNGKRRHTSSIVHDNEQARGSVQVDLNSIPPSSIERIDVLRDGAAAQYGSDAIAGVINITLKKSSALEINLTHGSNYSSEDRGYGAGQSLNGSHTDASLYNDAYYLDWTNNRSKKNHYDGKNTVLSVAKGFEFAKGFISGSIQYWKQGEADRAGVDPNFQYWGTNTADGTPTFDRTAIGQSRAANNGEITIDPREATISREGWWFGKSEMKDISAFVNSEYELNGNTSLYSFGGISKRTGRGPCFWREPGSHNTVRSIFPNGYLPNVEPKITDRSAAVGIRGEAGNIHYDVSQTYGHNDFNFRGTTLNVSLGDNSPTNFDGGGTKFTQFSTNIDMSTTFDWNLASDVNLAWGFEYRDENYEIYPGQEEAYINGGVPITDGPYGLENGGTGRTAAVGTQCVQAFHVVDQVDASRSNVAAYVDIETDIVDGLTVGIAGRYEDYSDFGSTSNGKISGRWEFADGLALRSAISTGFRAPALQQQNYSNRSLQSNSDGSLSQTGTFPVENIVSSSLGARSLEPETSQSTSLGLTYSVGKVNISVDAYYVDIDDRILLSEQFDGRLDPTGFQTFLDGLAPNNDFLGIEKVNYFINGLDTETEGVDIVVNWKAMPSLGLTYAANFTNTKIKRLANTPSELAPFTDQSILGRTNINNIENAAPDQMMHFTADYDKDNLNVLWRSIYYGSITAAERFAGDLAENEQAYDGEFIHNVETGYRFINGTLRLSLGVNNILDTYPEKRYKSQSRFGILPYSGYVPYGFTGRYVYTRLNYTFE